MISIVTDGATPREYYKDILDIYKDNVYIELKSYKEVELNNKIEKAIEYWEKGDYIDTKSLLQNVLDDIKKNRMMVDKHTISMIENNLANCYVKQQDQEEYKNYYILETAENYYQKALYHIKHLTKPKGIVFFNYAIFCLKLNLWKDDPNYIQTAQNNFKLMQQINKFVYTRKRSLAMYRFFILSKKYGFYSDFNNKILMGFGDRIF